MQDQQCCCRLSLGQPQEHCASPNSAGNGPTHGIPRSLHFHQIQDFRLCPGVNREPMPARWLWVHTSQLAAPLECYTSIADLPKRLTRLPKLAGDGTTTVCSPGSIG